MATLQPPPASDAASAIQAFSTSTRQAFEDFLEGHSSRYCISRQKRANIIPWLIDDQKAPINQIEHSQHYHAVHSFRYDAASDILLALLSEGHSGKRQVVVQEEIFKVIEQEHLLSKHAGQNMTWAAIRNTYYGIA